jgi:integration host factor subunit beta
MVRSELVAKIAEEFPKLTLEDAERAVDSICEEIIQALEQDNRVELRGFGSFSTRKRRARQGRNPKTGEAVAVPATHAVYFRAGKEILNRLNDHLD